MIKSFAPTKILFIFHPHYNSKNRKNDRNMYNLDIHHWKREREPSPPSPSPVQLSNNRRRVVKSGTKKWHIWSIIHELCVNFIYQRPGTSIGGLGGACYDDDDDDDEAHWLYGWGTSRRWKKSPLRTVSMNLRSRPRSVLTILYGIYILYPWQYRIRMIPT